MGTRWLGAETYKEYIIKLIPDPANLVAKPQSMPLFLNLNIYVYKKNINLSIYSIDLSKNQNLNQTNLNNLKQ